ncbi:Unknown protein, partial [Striga hermonthica]
VRGFSRTRLAMYACAAIALPSPAQTRPRLSALHALCSRAPSIRRLPLTRVRQPPLCPLELGRPRSGCTRVLVRAPPAFQSPRARAVTCPTLLCGRGLRSRATHLRAIRAPRLCCLSPAPPGHPRACCVRPAPLCARVCPMPAHHHPMRVFCLFTSRSCPTILHILRLRGPLPYHARGQRTTRAQPAPATSQSHFLEFRPIFLQVHIHACINKWIRSYLSQ